MIRASIYGRAGRDSEVRSSKSGKSYASVSVACSEGPDQATTWVRVVVFSERGIAELSTVLKGSVVAAIGRLKVGIWSAQGAEPKPDVTLLADSVMTAAPARDGARNAASAGASSPPDDAEPFNDAIPI